MRQFVSKNIYVILILAIAFAVFVTNYVPHTYLIGWDSLQTELAPLLAVKRALSAVWVGYQSFGFTSGMGDAADLVRSLFILLISLLLPNNAVRYVFHTLMYVIGGIGIFTLLQKTGLHGKKRVFAFVGAVFYLLNFGTIQIFYVPFEPYSIFFAFLPWEIAVFIDFIESKKLDSRVLITFILVNFLATSQAYLQTFFVVYVLVLTCFGLGYIATHRPLSFKKLVFACSLIFVLNLFWIAPQAYFLATSKQVVTEAKINQIATEDVFYQNKEKGNLKSFVLFRGFYYDLFGNEKNGSIPLFLPWKRHFDNPITASVPYLFFGIYLFGMLFARKKYHSSFIPLYLLVAVMLLSNTSPMKELNDVFREMPLVNQIFRSPFTKFIIPFSLAVSYFFAFGMEKIASFLYVIKKHFAYVLIVPVVLILYYSFPVFQGNFYSKTVKQTIPNEYFSIMEFFKTVDRHKRIAILPEPSFWGWYYHSWKYDGSGFLWWGIEQPMLSRTFDVWSSKSESYYWEIKRALDMEDETKLNEVLDKYGVDYLLLDPSILPTATSVKGLQYERVERLLKNNGNISLRTSFGAVRLYEVRHDHPIRSSVSVAMNLPVVGPGVKLTNSDEMYSKYGAYQTGPSAGYDYYQPYFDLQNNNRYQPDWRLEDTGTAFRVIRKLDFNTDHYDLLVATSSSSFYAVFGENVKYYTNTYTFRQEGNDFVYTIPKLLISSVGLQTEVANCTKPLGSTEARTKGNSLWITSKNKATGCFGYSLPFLSQKFGYLMEIENKQIKGRRLSYYILDSTKKQLVVQDELRSDKDIIIIPPNYSYGTGYEITLNNKSYDGIVSTNQIDAINIYAFPYEEMKQLEFLKKDSTHPKASFLGNFTVNSSSTFRYDVGLTAGKNTTLILYQQYDPGWKLYEVEKHSFLQKLFPFLGKEVSAHVSINNWANGWHVNQSEDGLTYTMVFIPQYLEYAGFVIAIASLLGIVIYLKKHHGKNR